METPVRILRHLTVLILLAGCAVEGGDRNKDAAFKAEKPPSCTDAAASWDWYLAGNVSPRALVTCAGIANSRASLLSLAVSETGADADRPEFERAVEVVRLLARAGEDRAQRTLAALYAGKPGWYGRNAYMGLFWRGVVRKRDPSYRQSAGAEERLRRFRERLTPESARDLAAITARWSPNSPVPNRLTIDSFLTFVLEADGWIPLSTRKELIDYGAEQGLRDWRMMFLVANQGRLEAAQRAALFQQESEKGSLLGLLFQFLELQRAEGTDDTLLVTTFLELLIRLGLDPNSFRADVFEDAMSVNANSSMADLERLLRGRSRPEQRTVALIALLTVCGDTPGPLCSAVADRFGPILPQAARNLGRIVAVSQRCPGAGDKMRCMSDNDVLGVLRDLFAFDYRDFSGQET